jgi:cytochrome bd ubiquinol oxidase subunit I
MLLTGMQWLRGKLAEENIEQQKWLLRAWIFAAPLGYIAIDTGWIVRCVGRQPWTVYNQLRTVDSVSHLPPSNVLTTLIGYGVVYGFLLFTALYFGSRIIRKGPNLQLPVPGIDTQPAIDTTPAEFVPDERPVEAQQ